MAGLAAVTDERIQCSPPPPSLTLPPAMVARMATTIDSIRAAASASTSSRAGRRRNTSQMGYGRARHISTVDTNISPNIRRFCASSGIPGSPISKANSSGWIIADPSSEDPAQADLCRTERRRHGLLHALADMNFCLAKGRNTPGAAAPTVERLLAAGARRARGRMILLPSPPWGRGWLDEAFSSAETRRVRGSRPSSIFEWLNDSMAQ